MAALVTPNSGDVIQASHIAQLTGLIAGSAGKGQLVQFHQYEDATNYANVFGNKDTTNGRALKVQYGDPSGTPITLATFQKSSSRIQSNDGTDYIDISNSGVAVTGAFSINGQSVGAGVKVYNVLDYEIVAGTDNTYAANNTTKLATLWTTVANAGGGAIYFPAGQYAFNASTTLDHGVGSTIRGIGIMGDGQATRLNLYGTTGPWFSFATAVGSACQDGFVKDLAIWHKGVTASGATIRHGALSNWAYENVYMVDSGGGLAPYYGIEIAGSVAQTNVWVRNCKFEETKIACIRVANSGSSGGLFVTGSDLSGNGSTSFGIDFVNAGAWDTVEVIGGLIKDHSVGIRKTAGAGLVSNVLIQGVKLDGNANYGIQVQPPTSSACTTWQILGCWISAGNRGVWVDETGGGTLAGVQVSDTYITGPDDGGIIIGAGVDETLITGNRINAAATNFSTTYGIDIGGASGTITDVIVMGNWIKVGGSASGAMRISSAADPVTSAANQFRGVNDTFGGSTGTSRVDDASNTFKA